ncbi:MAG: lipopolysaccharide biosynthesis protein [Rhodobacteraceae bacterium]|nr:lipopolysaccharide biosynthesis protein [Paracoccaceae bacterium]
MNFDLKFYMAVFLRRLHIFILIAALVSAASVAIAVLLPRVYISGALLMVESPQIPNALMAPTIQAAALEKLQTMENRLMTRANLLDIANRLHVFSGLEKMTPDQIVQAMHDNTVITKSANRGEATLMDITFQGESGTIAAGVVNEYVTLILKDDINTRTKSAEGTVDFFNEEVSSLGTQLDQLSGKILDFQNRNADALPSTLAFRMSQQTTLQGKLDTVEQEIKALSDQKERLIAIYNSTGQVTNSSTARTPEAQQLVTLNDQLTQALAVLSPTHPKVKLLQAQIAQLEVIVKSQTQAADNDVSQTSSMFDVQMADLDARLKVAIENRDQITAQMAKLQDTIDRTPANQIALDALNRDYSNAQQQYNTAVANHSAASAAQRVEALSKGERISVLDAATVPNNPAKPARAKIVAGGMVAGVLLGVGAIFLMELLNRSVKRPQDIVAAFGITPIVAIPYMRTPSETMRRRSVFIAMLLVAMIGIPLLLYAIHVLYLPLDVILSKIATRLGIGW